MSEAIKNVNDFGVKADGITDDLAAFNAAIAQVPAGGTLVIPPGTYKLSATPSFGNSVGLLVMAGAQFTGAGALQQAKFALLGASAGLGTEPSYITIDQNTTEDFVGIKIYNRSITRAGIAIAASNVGDSIYIGQLAGAGYGLDVQALDSGVTGPYMIVINNGVLAHGTAPNLSPLHIADNGDGDSLSMALQKASGSALSMTQTTTTWTGSGLYQNFATSFTGQFIISKINAIKKFIVGATGKLTVGGDNVPLATNAAVTIQSGAGAPSLTEPSGSLYLRTDGAVGSRLYISQGGGTWIAVTGV